MVVSGSVVSSISFLAESSRCACATAMGVAPRCWMNKRRKCRDPIPRRSASASTLESPPSPSSAPSSISRSARATVVEVPFHAGGAPTFRTAAQTRAKSGLEGRGGRRIIVDVVFFGRSRRAHRAAEDARGPHGDEELSVEARVARQTSGPAHFARSIPQLLQSIIARRRVGELAVFGHVWPRR